jgi:hypothetical protein
VSWSSVAGDLKNKFTWQSVKQKWNIINDTINLEHDDNTTVGKEAEHATLLHSQSTEMQLMNAKLDALHESNTLLRQQVENFNIRKANKQKRKQKRKLSEVVTTQEDQKEELKQCTGKHGKSGKEKDEELEEHTKQRRRRKKNKSSKKCKGENAPNEYISGTLMNKGHNMLSMLHHTIDTIQSECEKSDRICVLEKKVSKLKMIAALTNSNI